MQIWRHEREREHVRKNHLGKTKENQTIETSKQAANKRKTTLPFLNGVFKPVKHQNFGTLRNARNIGKGNGTKGRRRPKK